MVNDLRTDLPDTGALWLRWSWRDLRHHWIAVLAIGLVIAIGTGVYAGLSSTSTWRRLSNDASFAAGNIHSVRATVAPGTFAAEGELADIVRALPAAGELAGLTERLVVDTQVEVMTPDGELLVNGQVIGSALGTTGEDSHGYLFNLEETAIRTAADFGVKAYRREGKNGAWHPSGKRDPPLSAHDCGLHPPTAGRRPATCPCPWGRPETAAACVR